MDRSHSILRRLVVLVAFGILLQPALVARSQVRIPAAALRHEQPIQDLLNQGRVLEEQQRWGDALLIYEQGVKRFTNNHELKQRHHIARIQFDLDRRYADPSYLQTLSQSSDQRSLQVYVDVLRKIDSLHVDSPRWSELIQRGLDNLEIALGDREFLQAHLSHVRTDQIEQARHELRRSLNPMLARTQHDAQYQAKLAAQILSRRLGLKPQATIYEFTCGAVNALDWYSSYLTTDQYKEIMSQIEGNFVGLGVELEPQPDHLAIVGVIPNGPAGKAGLRQGDRIVAVEGKTVQQLTSNHAADLLRGPAGSLVSVKIQTPDQHIRQIRMRRDHVEIPSVEDVKLINPRYGVGYIKLTNFQRTTHREFVDALWKLHYQGMRSLIVDLRGNPGGLLDASVDLADLFVASGTIVSTQGRNPKENQVRRAHLQGTWQVPLTLLIDGDSASASEIFAGAILDHRRGTIVGQRSYGKGSVQGIFSLDVSSAGLRLTIAKFYSPSGRAISRNGIRPDIEVESPNLRHERYTAAKPAIDDNGQAVRADQQGDPILSAGIQEAIRKVAQR